MFEISCATKYAICCFLFHVIEQVATNDAFKNKSDMILIVTHTHFDVRPATSLPALDCMLATVSIFQLRVASFCA